MGAEHAYRVARAFVDGLAACGVEVVAVGAGSRSTSLALAFHDDGRFEVFSFIDERSAAFFALGAARATGKPAAVVTTSGTAAANLLPAAVEADVAGVPLILLTADRPPELHGVGAMQTVEQVGLLTTPSRWVTDLHTYDDAADGFAGHLAAQAVAHATGPEAGPVHVNIRFREPLTPDAEARRAAFEFAPVVRRVHEVSQPDPAAIEELAVLIAGRSRGLLHVGHLESASDALTAAIVAFSHATGYPVIAEATSRLRGRLDGAHLVDAADAVIRAPAFAAAFAPDLVVRLGRAALTRDMRDWLDGLDAQQIVFAQGSTWPDPSRMVTRVLAADEAVALRTLAAGVPPMGDPGWSQGWDRASKAARGALDAHLDDAPMFEGSIARDVALALPTGGLLVTSTSLPIRALDVFTPSDATVEALASRGANGIDGTTSMALGAAASSGRPTVLLSGDVAFLHDLGGLTAAARHGIPLVTVVIDNGGGRIFEQLPQAEAVERDTFDDLFATAHTLDLLHAAELFGLQFASVHDASELERVLRWAFTEGTGWIVRAAVKPADSLAAHRDAWAKAAAAVTAAVEEQIEPA